MKNHGIEIKRNENAQNEKRIIRIRGDVKIWRRRMKQQNKKKINIISSFWGRFCLFVQTPFHFDPSAWNWMLYFYACHCENWFTFNGCDSNWNINGYCHQQLTHTHRVLKLKTHFTGMYHGLPFSHLPTPAFTSFCSASFIHHVSFSWSLTIEKTNTIECDLQWRNEPKDLRAILLLKMGEGKMKNKPGDRMKNGKKIILKCQAHCFA